MTKSILEQFNEGLLPIPGGLYTANPQHLLRPQKSGKASKAFLYLLVMAMVSTQIREGK